MNYTGVIIKESLGDSDILDELNVLKIITEKVTPEHKTPWIDTWTMYTVEIPETEIESVVEKISHLFDIQHPDWYADFKNDEFHYVIFPNKVFKLNINNLKQYEEMKKYGMSIGIPDYQLDIGPKDAVWER